MNETLYTFVKLMKDLISSVIATFRLLKIFLGAILLVFTEYITVFAKN